MKKILILKFPYRSSFGGGESHTLTLVEELSKMGYQFRLISSCRVLLAEFKKRDWPAKKIWALPEPVAKWSLLVFPFLAIPMFLYLSLILLIQRFRGVRAIYCLSLTEKILATLPARLFGLKVFWMEHVGFRRWLTLNPLRIFYRLFSRLATVVVISQALQQQLRWLGLKEKNIKVIYNGFDFLRFQKLRLAERIQDENHFIVGTVCRLEKEKGLEFLLLAAQKAKTIIPNLKLIIVGDGRERKRLEWLARNLEITNWTQFVGWQKDAAQWIKDFDIFVLPSVGRESFGNVLVEALALERPIITSALEGTPEIVQSMQTGILVEPGKSEELAQAIIYLAQNPALARQLAENGRVFVEKNFPKEKMIHDFFQLFATI
ncbi:MAG: glycosyltransferase family 4 protein [Patescibacteria group bacterium]|nr:glycosyltransferase family 4 protein [Patescibacteria group bacterium]